MTSTNINPLDQAVVDFQELDIGDRLILLALLYQESVTSIPLDDLQAITQPQVKFLVQQIQQLSLEEQLTFLSDLLLKEEYQQTEPLLENYSTVDTTSRYPTHQYELLNSESKLTFWCLIAANLTDIIIDIPNDYIPTPSTIELLNFLQSLNSDELVLFLKQVL
ncbi:MAG TPA: orange carotenoid protein N-terminal domain-containing protein [Nostocaceae cyanobacterium]|nr:orange carotenoid protein N-terminal domain-containing protein [Nostocaceae cyanobacterium]